jgi:catechol 2,3-dioxygenase-like lactoylglutathione lyase family enzyme
MRVPVLLTGSLLRLGTPLGPPPQRELIAQRDVLEYLYLTLGIVRAMELSGLAELTLETTDLTGMERFYREVVGLATLAREPERVWLAVGERSRLGLWTPGEKEFGDRGGRHVHFAFSAAPGRLDALAARLGVHGVGVRGPVEHPGGDRSIYFSDPAGNLVEAWDFLERGQGAREGVAALA